MSTVGSVRLQFDKDQCLYRLSDAQNNCVQCGKKRIVECAFAQRIFKHELDVSWLTM